MVITVGLGYLLLVVLPVTTASLFLIDAGHHLAGYGLLGVSVGVTVASLLVVGFVWLLLSSVMLTLSSFLSTQRRRVLCFADDLERAHWWARLARLSDRLAFLDHRSAEEKLDDELDHLKKRYVSGDLSEVEFERGVARVLGTKTHARPPEDGGTRKVMSAMNGNDARRETLEGERLV